ncbi:MAG: glycosyltransferase family 4 protein [Pirellulales bacterium]|nr:glycosyltransferase family 4 protein [Pirellulales bacterium]
MAEPDQKVPKIVFIGALPPPVTGMTAMTAVIVQAFERALPVHCCNWSRGKPLPAWQWKLARLYGAVKSLCWLTFNGRCPSGLLYYPISSGLGLYYDLAVALTARALGYRLALHHHVYSYIDSYDWRVALLNRLVCGRGAHVVHCELMQQDFVKQYGARSQFVFIPPTVVVRELDLAASGASRKASAPCTLGFMSNLTVAKGLDDAITVFEKLFESGRNVRLVLAGPCMGPVERTLVSDLVRRRPEHVEYRGPIYGRDKARFFADIDAFLFPTRYRNESWGIVLTEALAAGRPVIARSRGCIPWIVRDGCGVAVDPADDFVDRAAHAVSAWIDDPAAYQAAAAAALRRSAQLAQDASDQLAEFVRWVAAAAGCEASSEQADCSAACLVGAPDAAHSG